MAAPLRVSTTHLECFRLYQAHEWLAEADLIATIKGEFAPTPAILLGQAFGQVLEQPNAYRVSGGYRCGDYTFSYATLAPAFALINRRGVFEAKATKDYGSAVVVAKADHLLGAHLREFKATAGTFNIDKYLRSAQWRFYLDVFEALQLTYDIFCLDDHGNGVVDLVEIHSFHLFPYPTLHADCCQLLAQFIAYVTARGLDGFLRARQEAA